MTENKPKVTPESNETQSLKSDNQNLLFNKYRKICKIGEGAYGIVIKCRNVENDQVVAIKRFTGSDNDPIIRKIAIREIKTLRRLKHPNLINLLEIFKKHHRYNLVFQFIDNTLLHEMEATPRRLNRTLIRNVLAQIINGTKFCHQAGVIHRDIKPENVLVSKDFHVKLCDFGFSRFMATGVEYTDYVATRWYRAPELLVGDTHYGPAVDVWAIGCVFAEMLINVPLWPGRSDLDQLYLITKNLGALSPNQQKCFENNVFFSGFDMPRPLEMKTLESRFDQLDPPITNEEKEILHATIRLEPAERISCNRLLTKAYFEDCNVITRERVRSNGSSNRNDSTPNKSVPSNPSQSDDGTDKKTPPNEKVYRISKDQQKPWRNSKHPLHQAPMIFSLHNPIPNYSKITKKTFNGRDITEPSNR